MSSLPPDPYRILGVSKDAQITEIRSAHRKLVLKCHPDKIQDPALKEAKQNEFQQVQQAYELLSNETEREKYDRKVEVFNDLARERERAKNSSARSSSMTRGTPKREYYHVKEASPRVSTFAKSGPYGRTPPRSWEDTTAPRMYEEPTRYARKTASYEKEKPSKRDEERRRRREEDEWAREKEKARDREAREARKAKDRKEEKDRIAREDRDREKRRDEKKRAQNDRDKEREKERKSATAEKARTRQPIIESSESSDSSDDDVVYEPPPPKADKKKSSSSRKTEDIDPPSTSERTRKYSGNMEQAIRYLTRSSGKAPAAFVRSQTYSEGSSKAFNTPMVPTPPPAPGAPFAPPPPIAEPGETSEEDMARRSSARPSLRRMSHETSRSSREKSSSHKKSSSSRDQPIIVESGSPSARMIPPLQKSHSERIPSHADRVPPLSRSQTESFTRPIPLPLNRSETWFPSTDRERERHERSRSRPTPTYSDEEDSEAERERRHRRSRRTHSPEPMPIPMPAQTHHRYTVDGTKSIPVRQKIYHEQPKSRMYQKGAANIIPNSSARRGPTASYARDYYADEPAQVFHKVKYATQFGGQDIQYSELPYSGSHRSDGVYAV